MMLPIDAFRRLPALALCLGIAFAVHAQNPDPAAPPEKTSAEPAEPGSVVPPEGEGDSWGYHRETTDDEAPVDETSADEASSEDRPEVLKARLIGPSGHRYVRELRRLQGNVGRLELSRQGDRLAFDRPTDRGFRGLFVAPPDGNTERCLTCESWDLRKSHVLSPTWHPSGRLLVAAVQGPAAKLGLDTWGLAGPDRGLHSELWAFTVDGRDAWQLTQVVSQGGTVTDPVFSFEGDRLAWTQRVDTTRGGRWGSWQVRVADFEIKRGLPRLGKVRRLDALPWPGYVSIHGFTEDDRGLWLTVTPSPGTAEKGGRRGLMIGRYDLDEERFEPLPAEGHWDALPSAVPRSERRIWVSDRGIDRPRRPLLPWRGDLWLSSESGRRQERLTYFNDPSSDHYLGEAWIADTTWDAGGDQVFLQVLAPDAAGRVVESLYRLRLDPAVGR